MTLCWMEILIAKKSERAPMMWDVETSKLKEPSKGVEEREKVEEEGSSMCTPTTSDCPLPPPSRYLDLEPQRAWYEGVGSERWAARWAVVGRQKTLSVNGLQRAPFAGRKRKVTRAK